MAWMFDKDEPIRYAPGVLLLITAGDHDYYEIGALLRVGERGLDLTKELSKFVQELPAIAKAHGLVRYSCLTGEISYTQEEGGDYETAVPKVFWEALIVAGLVEEVSYEELHLASYGKITKHFYCHHPEKQPHLFDGPGWRLMTNVCSMCQSAFQDESKPATKKDFLAVHTGWNDEYGTVEMGTDGKIIYHGKDAG